MPNQQNGATGKNEGEGAKDRISCTNALLPANSTVAVQTPGVLRNAKLGQKAGGDETHAKRIE